MCETILATNLSPDDNPTVADIGTQKRSGHNWLVDSHVIVVECIVAGGIKTLMSLVELKNKWNPNKIWK